MCLGEPQLESALAGGPVAIRSTLACTFNEVSRIECPLAAASNFPHAAAFDGAASPIVRVRGEDYGAAIASGCAVFLFRGRGKTSYVSVRIRSSVTYESLHWPEADFFPTEIFLVDFFVLLAFRRGLTS